MATAKVYHRQTADRALERILELTAERDRLRADVAELVKMLTYAERCMSNSPATYEYDLPEIRVVLAKHRAGEKEPQA